PRPLPSFPTRRSSDLIGSTALAGRSRSACHARLPPGDQRSSAPVDAPVGAGEDLAPLEARVDRGSHSSSSTRTAPAATRSPSARSEEHTSELQSRENL